MTPPTALEARPEHRPTFEHPAAPAALEDTGLSFDLVLQLVAKTLHLSGELSGAGIASRLGLTYGAIEPTLDLLKRERHCEIVGGALFGGPSYRYRLTDAGRVRAALFLEQNEYVGFAPVPIEAYCAYVRQFAEADRVKATRDAVRRAFSHLVLSERVLDQLGPAVGARHSVLVYGPPGNGKTVIAQAVGRLLEGTVAIPHAIAVDGQIVRLYDPVNHGAVRPAAGCQSTEGRHGHCGDRGDESHRPESPFDEASPHDARWIECHRPVVTVGGELTLDALELGRAGVGFNRAPLQALANCGVLVIDDFGRQHASPRDLLNRWIVPLESRVDYLTLPTGQKFELPFEVLVIFATNLKPSDLVDEAFLRRIHYKIRAESPTAAEFEQIFSNCCGDRGLACDRALVRRMIDEELRPRRVQLRGCQPRDLIDHALSLAAYLDRPPVLDWDLLQSACGAYFVDEREDEAL